MNKTSNKLETIFQEVSEYFANIPRITVTPGEGSPPDQYTISYQIIGVCKKPNEEVYSCEEHEITISLPFGFPHFPPNCMPESFTFHPDFDSSAICIGDIWEAEKSIVKLILHIGQMVSGEVYSKNNAFNEGAAEWYSANSSQLPFDSTDFTEVSETSSPVSDNSSDPESIDTLDDADFGTSFSLEEKDTESEDSDTVEVDTHRLDSIAKQKRFQALDRELSIIKEPFKGRQSLEEKSRNALNKAKAIFEKADTLEHQGEQQKALALYHSIDEIVSDYPNLKEAQERVQQAFDLLGDWVSKDPGEQHAPIHEEGDSSATESISKETDAEQRTFFEEEKTGSKKIILFAAGGGVVALIATLIISYSTLGSNLQKAEIGYEQCQKMLDANDFQGASQKCEEALDLATGVRLVKQTEKALLTTKIQSLINSPKLRQGLLGKTKVDGKYVTQSAKELLNSFKIAKKNGDSFFSEERWDEAASSYAKALNFAAQTKTADDNQIAEIHQKHPQAQFNGLLKAGKKFLSMSDWSNATDSFNKAVQLAKSNPNVTSDDINQLEQLANQAGFNTLREQGGISFEKEEWNTALTSYQGALILAETSYSAKPQVISSLKENIAKTEIYLTIEKGKKAFKASEWDDVVVHYEKAIQLLEENALLLSSMNTTESRAKLSRLMLHASIIKDKQDIDRFLKAEKYKLAIEKLSHIQQSIKNSQFRNQEEFQTIHKETVLQTKDAKRQLIIVAQSSYLTDNFAKLFLKHYPAAAENSLSAPGIEYQRNIGSKLLFRMQCTETTGGRPMRLQMDYIYNPANERWQFYSGE